jgi:CubicO group peptidase (beta-lactamase class C family)
MKLHSTSACFHSAVRRLSAAALCLFGVALLAQTNNALLSALDRATAQVLATGGTPGLAMAVVHDGQVVFHTWCGIADQETGRKLAPDTRFYIASTTKSLTALAAALLDTRGALSLDLTLDRALPGVRLRAPLDPQAIKLRDLLTMTHGISSGPVDFRCAFTGEYSHAGLLDLLQTHAPAKTGREFQYNNLGYVLFGLVLDSRFDAGWKTIIDREVLQPLGMHQTTPFVSLLPATALAMPHEFGQAGVERVYFAKDDTTLHPAGGHFSTAGDLNSTRNVTVGTVKKSTAMSSFV